MRVEDVNQRYAQQYLRSKAMRNIDEALRIDDVVGQTKGFILPNQRVIALAEHYDVIHMVIDEVPGQLSLFDICAEDTDDES